MSLIHWDKSVFTLHLREILEDHQNGDRTALVGLGAIMLGSIIVPSIGKIGKKMVKNLIKTGLSLYKPQKFRLYPYKPLKPLSSPEIRFQLKES